MKVAVDGARNWSGSDQSSDDVFYCGFAFVHVLYGDAMVNLRDLSERSFIAYILEIRLTLLSHD